MFLLFRLLHLPWLVLQGWWREIIRVKERERGMGLVGLSSAQSSQTPQGADLGMLVGSVMTEVLLGSRVVV